MGEPIDSTRGFEPAEREAWRAQVRRDSNGRDPEALRWSSPDGVVVEPLYFEAETARGAPGAAPFVRGTEARREWTVLHDASGADRDLLVAGTRRALEEGADGIRLDPAACALFERAADLAPLFELGAPVWLSPGARATAVAAACAERDVTVLSDPLATLATDGALPTSLERAYIHLADVLSRTASSRAVLVSARPYHEAGASAVNELAIVIASGLAYLRGLSDAGCHLAELPRRMLFELALDSDFFMGIAKLRAARLLWSKLLRTLGIDGAGQGMVIRARSSRRVRSVQEPELNVLRGTASTLAAVVGGAELISVAPFDRLQGVSSDHADRLARNTQLLMREESHLGRVLDPAGGSYFLESLTDSLARAAWGELGTIDFLGGVERGLADGLLAERAAEGAELRRRAVATRARGIVGVSRYPAPDVAARGDVKADVDAEPPPDQTGSGPKPVRDAAAGEGVVAALAVAANESSFAELTAALGAGDEPARAPALSPMREAEAFEGLRARADALPAERRRGLVLGVGAARALKPRMDFARDVLQVAGLEVVFVEACESAEAALAALPDPLPPTVIPCASDEDTPEVFGALESALRERGALAVLTAAKPTDALREAGATRFAYSGADLVDVLGELLTTLEDR